jgi:hypothetical protein
MNLTEVGCKDMEWRSLALHRGNWWTAVSMVLDCRVPSNVVNFLIELLGSHKGQYFVKFIDLFIYSFHSFSSSDFQLANKGSVTAYQMLWCRSRTVNTSNATVRTTSLLMQLGFPEMPHNIQSYSYFLIWINYRTSWTTSWTLTLSDPMSDLVQHYDFPVPLRCCKMSDTLFCCVFSPAPLSEPVQHFSYCSTVFSQQIAPVVLFLFLGRPCVLKL